MTTIATLADRVKAGAVLLDTKRPGWWREIVLDRLAMRSCHDCILGQVYGQFEDGLAELFGNDEEFTSEDIDHGFNASSIFGLIPEMEALADLWRSEIRSRLEAERSAK